MKQSLAGFHEAPFLRVANLLPVTLENLTLQGAFCLFVCFLLFRLFFYESVFFDFLIYSMYSWNFALTYFFPLLLESLVCQGGWHSTENILSRNIIKTYESRISFELPRL